MPDYVNPNSYAVYLLGPDGTVVKIKPHAKVSLPEFFDRYISKGFIKLRSNKPEEVQINRPKLHQAVIQRKREAINRNVVSQPTNNIQNKENSNKKNRQNIAKAKKIARNARPLSKQPKSVGQRMTVGRRLNVDATELLKHNLEQGHFPISNNIGVGILSYERPYSLKRLVESIIKHTDLRKTTIFISDDGSTNPELIEYLDNLSESSNFVIIKNKERIGIAGNSNRLLRCLHRFKYGMILNDDVEILNNDWEYYYVDAMQKTNMHHFIYHQVGIYGAKLGENTAVNGINLYRINEKPHGAVLAFSREMLTKCGYFDESYGLYGMEHVDWSQKAWEMGLQDSGFYDLEGSNNFFKIHGEKSSINDRDLHLKQARAIYNDRVSRYIGPTEKSIVSEITYVIPFRELQRNQSLMTVINNVRSQRFPVINIIIVEHDSIAKVAVSACDPILYYFVRCDNGSLFNKSVAFNTGVQKTRTSKVILHDADMLTQGHYTKAIWDILESAESCHLGGKVMYTDSTSANSINVNGLVDNDVQCERVVGYFEGGSLACSVDAYWECGAFNEDFWGYGCEDCDFYARLSNGSKWVENRMFNFLHLWHPRLEGWNAHHNHNRAIEAKLKTLPINERIIKQREQLIRNGYLEGC